MPTLYPELAVFLFATKKLQRFIVWIFGILILFKEATSIQNFFALLTSQFSCEHFNFSGFGCADGKDRALHASVPFLGFSCSSKGNAPLQPSHAGDREGSYGQFNPNTT